MNINFIKKRDGELQKFELFKVSNAVMKSLEESKEQDPNTCDDIANLVYKKLEAKLATQDPDNPLPTVEDVQDLVETTLMELGLFATAKGYILYRSAHTKARTRNIFQKRTNLKPYEYPDLMDYVDAVRHSYWLHSEFNYTSDIQDFMVNITDSERSAIKKSMLAIAQIEVAVKVFWGDIYKKMPKPEIGAVGFTFAESEVRHMNAYSHLLELLNLNDDFKSLTQVPVMKDRIKYLEQVIGLSKSEDNRDYALAVLLFSLFIEHVSLFSQFLIMMSFNKHKNLFKGISNVVEATSKEEQIHGMFGIELINLIREENPDWFDEEMKQRVEKMCLDAYEAECNIVDWIFEAGELDMLPKNVVKEFIKQRLNNSLESIGFTPVFNVNLSLMEQVEWFDNEVIATKHVDFFQKRSINYNKRSASITKDDLF